MKVLRTPPERFEFIQDFSYQENYLEFEDMRMHYIDEGKGEVILALHGEPTWSYLYRKFIPVLKDYRFIAPDFIGFGKSDKIVGWKNYSFDLHLRSLENFINQLDLQDITLIVQDWGGLLGLSLLGAHPDRFKRVVILNTFLPRGKKLPIPFRLWQAFARLHPSLPISTLIKFGTVAKPDQTTLNAYQAPFPDKSYKDGARAFPQLIPSNPNDPGVAEMNRAREVLKNWKKPALILFSDKDPVMSGLEKFFIKLIPASSEQTTPYILKNASHFLQEEKGEEIAAYIDRFMKTNA